MSSHVEPHGGTLVDCLVSGAGADALRQRINGLPRITLDRRELADLELMAVGAASPLRGFLGRADYESVCQRMRLADGTVWSLPFTLAVEDALAAQLKPGADASLWDETGNLWGVIRVSDVFTRDPEAEAQAIYGTADPAHPGVAYLLARPRTLVGGDVQVLPLPSDLPFAEHRLTPRALRGIIAERGWRRVAGFQTRNPIHRAHEYLTKVALEVADGLVIHPLVGETKGDDVPASVRFRTYEVLADRYYPKDRVILSAFPAAMRYAGPREAVFHAIVRKNYGITHLLVGRDHAGVGKYYPPFAAQEIFDQFDEAEIGVAPLRLDATFYCRACGSLASLRTCPHSEEDRLVLSGTRVREILKEGGNLPVEFTRPEVAEILRAHYSGTEGVPQGGSVASSAAGTNGGRRTGVIVWFTGLSGAGKTTLATAVRAKLEPTWSIETLDGDVIRTNLSHGLGFSKEDRDTNIRRIGFVARLVARHGVMVLVAAISPYAEVRDEVRQQAEAEGVGFVEIFVDASLETLVDRDVKGLYKRALAGEIKHFTGVSDPYEAPPSPELVIRSDRETVEASADRIVAALAAYDPSGPAGRQ